MAKPRPWQEVRLLKDVRIFGRYGDNPKLYDERTNFKPGTNLELGIPERLFIGDTQKAVCRILKKDGNDYSLIAYVAVSDFGDRNLLKDASAFFTKG